MTRYKLLTAIMLLFATVSLSAQNYEDIIRYSQPQYMGTARSMAMGSAFGSLGGDFSALGINPAGIAVYRTSEFTFTPSLIFNSTESNFNGNLMKDNKTTFSLNQVGYVGTYRPMREVSKGVVSTHFGVGYNRNNNFNYKSMALSPEQNFSITNLFLDDAAGINRFDLENYNNLTGLAYNAFVFDYDQINAQNDSGYTSYLYSDDTVDQIRVLQKEGYTGEISITGGINISNILLLGANINFHSLKYSQEFKYIEKYSSQPADPHPNVFDQFTINEHLDVSGNGINLKLGAILKLQQFRVGVAYHSPTWYKIEEEYGTRINSSFFNPLDNGKNTAYAQNYGDRPNVFDYKISTPEKLITSASYILGKLAILSFDYERSSYKNGKFNPNSTDDITDIKNKNDDIKKHLTTSNNYRVGAEFRINPLLSLRAGYAFQPSPFKASPKEYENQSISAGIGYRNRNYFIDLAYRNTAFKHSYSWYPSVNEAIDPPREFATVKSTDHYATLTLGWKF